MVRAKRHYIPVQIWHLTHRCHKKEFLLKPNKLPIAFSISSEYYKNSVDPIHSYEIASLTAFNIIYMTKPFKSKRVNVFLGGGAGWLEVPKEEEPDDRVKGFLYNLEAGINVRLFRKVGFYCTGKYLY